jgi:site-specific DNA recombinase
MQGQRSKDRLYYRCRVPSQYALATKIVHPRNVYLSERELLPPPDGWLALAFAPHRLEETIALMQAAQPDIARTRRRGSRTGDLRMRHQARPLPRSSGSRH